MQEPAFWVSYQEKVFNIKIPKNLLYTKECYSVQKRRGAAGERVAPYFVSMTDELIKTESAS